MSIFTPSLYLSKIIDIDLEILEKLKIKAILLDVDNTLAFNGKEEPFEGVIDWINKVKLKGYEIFIISNNNELRVKSFSEKINLQYMSNAKKPFPKGFKNIKNRLKLKSEEILVIGDQVFTDILGANLSKMKSILLDPIDLNEGRSIKIKRILEKPVRIKILRKKSFK